MYLRGQFQMSQLLEQTCVPEDVKRLGVQELEQLSTEVRDFIIQTVSRTGGHLAANLGVVELTVALLKVFSPPADKIVWDTGHQTYAYKVLTGRRDRMASLRQFGGLSGFQRTEESDYDAFGAGHAGTGLSAALGMAAARDRQGGGEHVIAVMGDGAAGCGISFEALNNVAASTSRLIVVLNDNKMSIGANVGSMSRYLGSLLASPRYNRLKRNAEKTALRMRMGWMRSAYYRFEEAVKSLFVRSVIFEEFGLRYIGPIDGHSIPALLDALRIAADSEKPILLHVSTSKGKGYDYAEDRPDKWHGTHAFDVETGEMKDAPGSISYSGIFGKVLVRIAEEDRRVVAITAAMGAGTGLTGFASRFPDRFFDVGISEEHSVVFAAGLAARGLVPVLAIYSSFFQRAVDCIIHDVCLQNLPVVLCLDRAGLVGEDGPTHHGVFDIALLRSVPNLVYMQPADEAELACMLHTAVKLNRPVAIRYPKGPGSGKQVPDALDAVDIGKAQVLREGREVEIWALGDRVGMALGAAELLVRDGIDAGVVNARFVRPLDASLLRQQIARTRLFVTLENGVANGGFGDSVVCELVRAGYKGDVRVFGWPDAFVSHGATSVLEKEHGQTAECVAATIRRVLAGS